MLIVPMDRLPLNELVHECPTSVVIFQVPGLSPYSNAMELWYPDYALFCASTRNL